MSTQSKFSARDESLAMGLYTGVLPITGPQIRIAHFEYSFRRRGLLDAVAKAFNTSSSRPLSSEHLALLRQGEKQSPEDLALAERMQDVQRDTIT